jgi:riboflavin kinase/FMN adenylyltransferase
MLYIGNRPTINGNLKRSIEVNLFDFNKDIYGETLKINLIAYLRGDIKFNGLDALKEQLHKDKQSAINALKNS